MAPPAPAPPTNGEESHSTLLIPESDGTVGSPRRAKTSIVSFATDQVVVVEAKSISIQSDSLVLKGAPSPLRDHTTRHSS